MPQVIAYRVLSGALEGDYIEGHGPHVAGSIAGNVSFDNAKEMIDDLTLLYNKVRQAAITSELLEITTAQMALE